MRASVERDDPRVMDGLHREDDVAWGLHDLVHAAVGGLEPGHAEGDAAFAEAAVLRTVRRMQTPLFGQRRAPCLRLGRFGRDSAVRRIDDERRPVVDVAAGQPEAVVVAGLRIVRSRLLLAVEHIEDQLVSEQGVPLRLQLPARPFELLDFGVGQDGLVRPRSGALQRGDAVVRPHALEIRLPERVPRCRVRPGARRASPRPLRVRHQNHRCEEDGRRQGEVSSGHGVSSCLRGPATGSAPPS